MSLNETALNEAFNETAVNATNATVWNINDITDVKKTLNWLSDSASELLTSWGYEPSYVFFVLLLVIGGFAILQHFFIKGSSGVGGLFKYAFFAVLVVIVLMVLGII